MLDTSILRKKHAKVKDMKLIQVNKFLYPKGGADKYCLWLIEELSALGHEVLPFGMSHQQNIDSPWSKYFTENIDYYAKGGQLKMAKNLIWNKEAAKKFGELLDESKPQLVHAHNIYHQLSPSILPEAKKRNIPVIMTLHDYKLVCPNYRMFCQGKHCEACIKGSYLNCLWKNCYDSYPRSALAVLESFLHNKVWHTYRDNLDLLISPSAYLKSKLVEAGWPAEKIRVLINPAPNYSPQEDGKNLLYLGRLTKEKGVDVLLKSLVGTSEHLDIAGTGPEEESLKQLAKELGVSSQVNFRGHLSGEDLEKIKKEAKAIILPSIWAENMSLVLLESLAYGKLIIATTMGGTPEVIKDGETGWLFPAGDHAALKECYHSLNNITPEEREFRKQKIKELIEPLAIEKHLQNLLDIYQEVLNKY